MEEKLELYSRYLTMSEEDVINEENKCFAYNGKIFAPDLQSKIYLGLISIRKLYHDRTSNESYYEAEQSEVIIDTCNEIEIDLIEGNNETAAIKLVGLQLLLDLSISLKTYIRHILINKINISEYIDTNKYFGNDLPPQKLSPKR